MHIPKNYFHDKVILALLGVNLALAVLAVFSVLLGVNPSENANSIVAYRSTTKIGQISGATSDLYQFAFFSVLVTAVSAILSLRLFVARKQLSHGILALCALLNLMTIIIFTALTRTL